MNQCLRCSKPCEASAVFCDECRSLLRNEFRRRSASRSSDPDHTAAIPSSSAELASLPTSPLSTSAPSLIAQKQEKPGDELAERDTKQQSVAQTPRASKAPITPHPPALDDFPYQDSMEQTMSRLSEAAQLIAEAEVERANRRLPRASRLAPMRDISADIRRESTPLPKFTKRSSTGASDKVSTSGPLPAQQDSALERERLQDGEMPDLWPWLDSEVEENENEDSWANRTDPLISRHIPNSVDAARIEEEDIKRALAEGMPTSHDLQLIRRPRHSFALRIAFAVLALLAVIALILDSVLLSVVVTHTRRNSPLPNGPTVPTLMLSPDVVSIVDASKKPATAYVQVSIRNFPASDKVHHKVQLTHDVQESVTTTNPNGSSIVLLDTNGSATVTIKVDSNWSIGFDQVYAEDMTSHYTVSATLQVEGAAPSSPAHLGLFDQNGAQPVRSLDFGSVVQGADSVLPLMLKNSGSGSITWSAGSNQPWLLVTPDQGMFSQSQAIDVAAQTINLKPGTYTGNLTLSSNVSAQPQIIPVTLTVQSPGQGAVLAPTPAVLAFTTTDGSPVPKPLNPNLTLYNPGNQTLNWSLAISASIAASNQTAHAYIPGICNNWLCATPDGGVIPPHSSKQITVWVNSNNPLPGAYQGELQFSAPGAVDPTQIVSVSLTVQPHCGLVTNSGYLSFTAVLGNTNPSNQSLGLNATASCAGESLPWKATLSSQYNWLSATPTTGTLAGTTSEFVSVGANAAGLPAKTYYGFIAFATTNSTQTVMVQLTVQPKPPPGAPIMSAAPLNLNFSSTSGQPNPKGQVVTISNTGKSPLSWSTSVTQIVSAWLSASPTGGTVQPGQTGQVVINVNTSFLSPGTYAGQIGLSGTDSSGKPASGSGQVVSINLVVQPPCTLTQPSSSSLAFTAVQGPYNPISQTVLITGTGNCAWPLAWNASVPASAPWLSVNPFSGSIKANGQSSSFTVQPESAGTLSAGTYTTTITISATDSAGIVATGSPQAIAVTLTVLPPCLPVIGASSLTFSATQEQSSPGPQSVQLSEKGTCSRPVIWMAVVDANSSGWLSASTTVTDTGGGIPLPVAVNSTSLAAGTYTGKITLTATDNNGNAVGTAQTITVTLTVTNTVSGTVMACQPGPIPLCTTFAALPGASLTLFDSSNHQVAATTADASGNFILTGLASGSYTVTITGTDSNNVHYSTSGIPLIVTASAIGVTLQVYPG